MLLGAEKKDFYHAVSFVDGVGNESEDVDYAFDKNRWQFGDLIELQFNDLCTSFAFDILRGHVLYWYCSCNRLELVCFRSALNLVYCCYGIVIVSRSSLGWCGHGIVL